MKAIVELLEFFAEQTKDETCFTSEQLGQLWTQFVVEANGSAEMDWFFENVLRSRDNARAK